MIGHETEIIWHAQTLLAIGYNEQINGVNIFKFKYLGQLFQCPGEAYNCDKYF